MLKTIKVLFFIALGLVGLLLLILIMTPLIIDMDKYKNMAAKRLGDELNREISIENISLSIFTGLGVSLNNLQIKDSKAFSGEFISIKSFDIKVKIIPLIFKNIEVEKIILNEPKITIKRDLNGNWNFDDIKQRFGNGTKSNNENNQQEPGKKAADPKGEVPTKLLVSKFAMKNGTIAFTDKKTNRTTKIKEINLFVKNIFSGEPILLKLTAILPGKDKKNFFLESTFKPSPEPKSNPLFSINKIKELTLSVNSLDLDHFKPYFEGLLPQIASAGKLDFEIAGSMIISPFSCQFSGELGTDGLKLENSNLHLSPKVNFQFSGDKNNIDFKNLRIESKIADIELSGQISGIGSNPCLNIKVNPSSIMTQDIVELLKSFKINQPPQLSISEKLKLSGIVLEGFLDDLKLSGEIELNDMNLSYEDVLKKPTGQSLNLKFKINYKP